MFIRTLTLPVSMMLSDVRLATNASSSSPPVLLFSNGEQGMWYDPSDISTMFQDSAGLTPVTGANQPVGKILDKSGNNHPATQSVSAKRPMLRLVSGVWSLEFDGVDDFLQTTNIDFSAQSEMTVFAGVTKASDTTAGVVVELGTNVTSVNGTFALQAPDGASATYSSSFRGSVTQKCLASGYVAPNTSIIVAPCSFGFFQTQRTNAVTTNGNDLQGTGDFSNLPLYIGMRAGTSLPFSGKITGLIIRGKYTFVPALQPTEQYLADKSGVIL